MRQKGFALIIALLILALVGSSVYIFYLKGYIFKNPSQDTTSNNSNKVVLNNFAFVIPTDWKLDGIDNSTGAVITTQTNPYTVKLFVNIKSVKQSDLIWDSMELGQTSDGASFYAEAGVGGARYSPYIIIYDNGDTYKIDWEISSNQKIPESEGLWTPDHNFTETDLINITKSLSKNI